LALDSIVSVVAECTPPQGFLDWLVSLLVLEMEEERTFLLDNLKAQSMAELQQLLERLRDIRQRKQLLWEQLEARQEGTQELFDEVVLSFNTWKASVSFVDNEASQSSDDGDDLLLLPPDAFADPDSAATCMLEMERVREELPYRPALSLRKPPPCFPHPVFRQSLGGLARASPWERRYEPSLPLLPGDVGGDGIGSPAGERRPKAEHLPSDCFRPLSLSWSGAWDNWPVLSDTWEPGDEPADLRSRPRTGVVENGWGPPRVETSPPGDSPAVLWRCSGEPPDHGMDERRPCSPADVGWTTT
jgi:hypothetical protein